MNYLDFFIENQWLILIAGIWTLAWTGWALWIAARKKKRVWFIVLLIVNTLAILEILYIFIFSKDKGAKIEEKPDPEEISNFEQENSL